MGRPEDASCCQVPRAAKGPYRQGRSLPAERPWTALRHATAHGPTRGLAAEKEGVPP